MRLRPARFTTASTLGKPFLDNSNCKTKQGRLSASTLGLNRVSAYQHPLAQSHSARRLSRHTRCRSLSQEMVLSSGISILYLLVQSYRVPIYTCWCSVSYPGNGVLFGCLSIPAGAVLLTQEMALSLGISILYLLVQSYRVPIYTCWCSVTYPGNGVVFGRA